MVQVSSPQENLVASVKGAQDGERKNHHRGKYEVKNGYSYGLTLKTQQVIELLGVGGGAGCKWIPEEFGITHNFPSQ